MLLVRHRGTPVALVTGTAIHLLRGTPDAEIDTEGRWVLCMAFFARDIVAGITPGPYSEERAHHFARHVLMPDPEFRRMTDLPDALIADVFDVPYDQVEEKRVDLALAEWLRTGHTTLVAGTAD